MRFLISPAYKSTPKKKKKCFEWCRLKHRNPKWYIAVFDNTQLCSLDVIPQKNSSTFITSLGRKRLLIKQAMRNGTTRGTSVRHQPPWRYAANGVSRILIRTGGTRRGRRWGRGGAGRGRARRGWGRSGYRTNPSPAGARGPGPAAAGRARSGNIPLQLPGVFQQLRSQCAAKFAGPAGERPSGGGGGCEQGRAEPGRAERGRAGQGKAGPSRAGQGCSATASSGHGPGQPGLRPAGPSAPVCALLSVRGRNSWHMFAINFVRMFYARQFLHSFEVLCVSLPTLDCYFRT